MLSSDRVILGIDVGNVVSGFMALVEGEIFSADIIENGAVFPKISGFLDQYKSVKVAIEDIKPYAGNLSQQAIDTCKFIGELSWRMREINADFTLITRSSVRKWVFDAFNPLVLPLVQEVIRKRDQKNNDGKNRKPSFVYVNDSMVIKSMKKLWSIPDAPPGKGYIHGLRSHSWQALGLASYFAEVSGAFSSKDHPESQEPSFFSEKAA